MAATTGEPTPRPLSHSPSPLCEPRTTRAAKVESYEGFTSHPFAGKFSPLVQQGCCKESNQRSCADGVSSPFRNIQPEPNRCRGEAAVLHGGLWFVRCSCGCRELDCSWFHGAAHFLQSI